MAVLDISMPGMTGLQVAAALHEELPGDAGAHPQHARQHRVRARGVRAGAHGYLLKDMAATELRDAIRAVHAGESYFSPQIAASSTTAVRGELEEAQRGQALDAAHRAGAGGAARHREGGDQQGDRGGARASATARWRRHRESLMRKLRIRTVAGLTRFALEAGLDVGEQACPKLGYLR